MKLRDPLKFLVLALSCSHGSAAPADTVHLAAGGSIEGKVVKRTAESVFIDVGYTILAVPVKEVKEVKSAGATEPAEKRPAGEAAGGKENSPGGKAEPAEGPGGERRVGIFFSMKLDAGSIKDKAREVGSGVVQIVCPGKTGSGFIINDVEGYVVTNNHVVEGDQDIAVVIYVREEHDFRKVRLERVKIVALNPFLDLALLQLDSEEMAANGKGRKLGLRKVYLGDTSVVRVGDPVFAIGAPLGLERTVTEGIVSNNRRALGGLVYVQTSAPINPGNSGGPLFNDHGEVVGITSLKASFGESLGFAIPVDYLKDFLANREAFAFDKNHPNSGIRYLPPPRKAKPEKREL